MNLKKYISCGKFNFIYLYIILGSLFLSSLTYFIFSSITYNDNEEKKDNHIFIKLFSLYFGQILLYIPEILVNKVFKTKNQSSSLRKKSPAIIEYIFNDPSDRITHKDQIIIFCISLLKLLVDGAKLISLIAFRNNAQKYFYNEHYYLIELFFLFLLSILIYKIKFYKHQYFSIVFILLLGLIRFIIKSKYYIEDLPNISVFIIILLFQILISFFDSFIVIYTKGLMENKYISPYKACYIFAIINSIIIIIIYFIITFIDCSQLFCTIEYDNKMYIIIKLKNYYY